MRFPFFRPGRSPFPQTPGRRALRQILAGRLVCAAVVLTAVLALEAWAASTEKLSGTYRIEGWRGMEKRGLYHFFYLHPSGQFLLGAAWPGHETSRFAGTWSVTGGRVTLQGRGKVETNQGNWTVAFLRTYRVSVENGGFRLAPIPEKNRYGLMGWPNAFNHFRNRPAPNLPKAKIPSGEEDILRHIRQLLEK